MGFLMKHRVSIEFYPQQGWESEWGNLSETQLVPSVCFFPALFPPFGTSSLPHHLPTLTNLLFLTPLLSGSPNSVHSLHMSSGNISSRSFVTSAHGNNPNWLKFWTISGQMSSTDLSLVSCGIRVKGDRLMCCKVKKRRWVSRCYKRCQYLNVDSSILYFTIHTLIRCSSFLFLILVLTLWFI